MEGSELNELYAGAWTKRIEFMFLLHNISGENDKDSSAIHSCFNVFRLAAILNQHTKDTGIAFTCPSSMQKLSFAANDKENKAELKCRNIKKCDTLTLFCASVCSVFKILVGQVSCLPWCLKLLTLVKQTKTKTKNCKHFQNQLIQSFLSLLLNMFTVNRSCFVFRKKQQQCTLPVVSNRNVMNVLKYT